MTILIVALNTEKPDGGFLKWVDRAERASNFSASNASRVVVLFANSEESKFEHVVFVADKMPVIHLHASRRSIVEAMNHFKPDELVCVSTDLRHNQQMFIERKAPRPGSFSFLTRNPLEYAESVMQ